MDALTAKYRYVFLVSFILIADTLKAQYWKPVAGEIAGARFTGIAARESSPMVIAATFQSGIYRSTDLGDTWQQVFSTQDSIFSLVDIDGKHFCAGGKGFTCISSDSGATWTRHPFPFPVAVARLAFHPSGVLIAGTGSKWDMSAGNLGKGVWLSSDSGKTWSPLNTGITKTNPLVEALAITPSGTILIGIYDSNVGLSGKYGIMKLDSLTGIWQRMPLSVNAPFNQNYIDQDLRIESVFNINITDGEVVASIAGVYSNFGYAFSIQKSVQDIDNLAAAWKVKWVVDSIPSTGSFYEHITNLFKDSRNTVWASVSGAGNEINNHLFTGSLTADAPWAPNMDSITEQTGRFLFAEAANGRLYSIGYFTGSQVFVRADTTAPVSVDEIEGKQYNSWQLFPNPANRYIQLSNSANAAAENIRLTLYDALGNKIMEQAIKHENEVLVPLSDKLSSGFYILSIATEKQQQVLQFIKE